MATMKTTGFNNFLNGLKSLGEDTGKIVEDMLEAGSEVCIEEWKNGISAEEHRIRAKGGKEYITKQGYVDTGNMLKSVGRAKKSRKGTAEIYPQGKDRKGVRNATKAYILHYGKSSIPGTRFVDKIESKAEPEVAVVMGKVMDDYLNKHGL